jgi:hypothetical protein
VSAAASHPLKGSESQSPNPFWHVTAHVPPVQAALLACASAVVEHAWPQPPQLSTLASDSQPLTGFWSQSSKPTLQPVAAHTWEGLEQVA